MFDYIELKIINFQNYILSKRAQKGKCKNRCIFQLFLLRLMKTVNWQLGQNPACRWVDKNFSVTGVVINMGWESLKMRNEIQIEFRRFQNTKQATVMWVLLFDQPSNQMDMTTWDRCSTLSSLHLKPAKNVSEIKFWYCLTLDLLKRKPKLIYKFSLKYMLIVGL